MCVFVRTDINLYRRLNVYIYTDHHKDIRALDESPFERLRRRALMKKLQAEESKKLKISPLIGEGAKKDIF